MNMYAAVLQGVILDAVIASPDVESVWPDNEFFAAVAPHPGPQPPGQLPPPPGNVSEKNAPWHLARISQRKQLAPKAVATYTYNATAGLGVDIYVLDSGVYVAHAEFGGRAKMGALFGGHSVSHDRNPTLPWVASSKH